eukprot:scaffold20169_cov69-Phaeocystis_antarctica.AAC.7
MPHMLQERLIRPARSISTYSALVSVEDGYCLEVELGRGAHKGDLELLLGVRLRLERGGRLGARDLERGLDLVKDRVVVLLQHGAKVAHVAPCGAQRRA